ncbi:ABC transporter substrate-binding protein [Candidatus Atribacteria bacterium HGW-Atribacteria-1]|nr:MAG: ABC transporter substrate-binding protein [Candidatus Atribacteria bacterium HGW-Atribacteria-1]
MLNPLKRRVLIFVIILLLVGAIGTQAKEVTLEVLLRYTEFAEGQREVFATIKEKLGIKSEVSINPAGVEGHILVLTKIATNEMPDILNFTSGALLMGLGPERNFVDITDQPFMANLLPEFKNAVTVNGKVYGIPAGCVRYGGIAYNKNIYKELGLEIPKTWAELMDNCEKIKAAGYIPFYGGYATAWSNQILMLADYYNVNAVDPEFANKFTTNQAHYADSPALLRGWEKLAEIHSRGFLNKDAATATADDIFRMYGEGKVAHFAALSFVFSIIRAAHPEAVDFFGMFPVPSDDPNINGITIWVSDAWVVTNAAKDKLESAMKWMEFMTTQEAIDLIASKVSDFPGSIPIKGVTIPPNVKLAIEDELQDYDTCPALEFLSVLKGVNFPNYCQEVGLGMKTPLEAAKDYDKELALLAKQKGLKGW